MIVLVTGAAGFLGAHLVRELLRRGHSPRALVRPGRPRDHLELPGVQIAEGDLGNEASLKAACRGAQGLVHCAARTGFWSRQNREQRKTNVEGTSALLRAAHKMSVERIVHVSSVAAVGGTRDARVLDEGASWNLERLKVNYAITKRAGEERALAAAWGGMPVVVVNPAAILGPRLDGSGPSSLISSIAAGKLLWGPAGGQSFTDVEDVCAGIVAALERGRCGERYILAGHNLHLADFYRAVASASGGRAPRLQIGYRAGRVLAALAGVLDVMGLSRPPWAPERWRACGWYLWFDSGKAERELGYRVRPLEEILRRATALPAEDRSARHGSRISP